MASPLNFNPQYYYDERKDTPTLFIHGFMGSGTDWLPIINKIKLKSITIDLPGHGTNTNLNYKSIAEVAQNLLNNLPLKKYHLIAYSMGGRLALEMLQLNPHLFDKIVIESAHPGLTNPLERLKSDQTLIIDPFDHFLKNWFARPLFGKLQSHPHFHTLLAKRLKNSPTHLQQALNFLSLGTQNNLWPFLQQFPRPLNYLSGSEDQKYHDIGNNLTRKNHKIIHHSFAKAGHNIHFEQESQFISFLDSIL